MTVTRLAAAPLVALWVVAFGLAGVAAAETQRGEGVSSFTLDNGMEVVVIPDRRAPVVTHMVWYKIGGADEERGKSGIAHFFEHLMFKGTANHKAGEFSRAVAEIGGNENAFTSNDYTAYFQQVTPQALPTMMAFEADRMRGLVLSDAVIGPERDVVMEERRQRIEGNPGAVLSEETQATLYQNHPYGVPVIGWMHEIAKLNRQDAIDFYNRYYAPNNAVLVVAGDVDAGEVLALAKSTYGAVPRGPDLPPRQRPQEPPQDTRRTVTLKDPRVTLPSVQISVITPSYTSAAPGEAEALDLLSEILGGGMRSRLYQELVVKTGIASSAGAYYRGSALDPSSFTVYAAPRAPDGLAAVEAAVTAEIAKIAADGVSADELDRAKNRFTRSMIFARDNQQGMARIYGTALTTGQDVADVEEWPDRVRAVTAEQVRDAARKYLKLDSSVTSYLLPANGDRS
ncbi:MAG: insulinase family protein [Rhizobiaceae bacterium]|nr:insulinase family protein [Rhizobiaceae bacterium]